jgi:hypothetical protein
MGSSMDESLVKRAKTMSQILIGAIEVLTKAGFAVTKAEIGDYTGGLTINCGYFEDVPSPKFEWVKLSAPNNLREEQSKGQS